MSAENPGISTDGSSHRIALFEHEPYFHLHVRASLRDILDVKTRASTSESDVNSPIERERERGYENKKGV